MSGFEDYQQEIVDLDKQIAHYVAICDLRFEKPLNRDDIEELLHRLPAGNGLERASQALQALLILRIRLETEMIEQGFEPPELRILPHSTLG